MLARIRTALVLLPITLLGIWMPWLRLGFVFFISALVSVGMWEYFVLVRRRAIEPEVTGAAVVVLALIFTAHWGSLRHLNLVLTLGFLFVTMCHLFFRWHTIGGMAAALFGVLYLGWLPAHFVMLRDITPAGPGLLTLLLGAVALSDSGAMYIGSRYGRHKLAPKTSPNKSWEGAFAGLAGGVAAGFICIGLRELFNCAGFPDRSAAWYAVTGAVLALTGQVGDLVESMLKRDAGVKDSGTIFPGHGGVLDRCDGYLFAGPVLYYWLKLV